MLAQPVLVLSLYHVLPGHSTKQKKLFTFLTEFSTLKRQIRGFHRVFHLFHRVFNSWAGFFFIRIVMLCGIFWLFVENRGEVFCFFQKNGDRKFSVFPKEAGRPGRNSPIWNIYAAEVFNIPPPAAAVVENFIHNRPKTARLLPDPFAAVCRHTSRRLFVDTCAFPYYNSQWINPHFLREMGILHMYYDFEVTPCWN